MTKSWHTDNVGLFISGIFSGVRFVRGRLARPCLHGDVCTCSFSRHAVDPDVMRFCGGPGV